MQLLNTTFTIIHVDSTSENRQETMVALASLALKSAKKLF